jgi:23S rRNA (adenine2503-C2)-methyltransferase
LNFLQEDKNEITLNIFFQSFNDSIADADELIKVYRRVPADLVNIIEYNPIDAKFENHQKKSSSFMDYLERHKVMPARRSRERHHERVGNSQISDVNCSAEMNWKFPDK